MNTQIIITPAGVLWVAGAIVSISAAAGVLIRIYKHFRKPGETQDHRIAELAAGAHVGVTLPAKPLSSVEPRQQGSPFPATPAPMLASPCRQSLCLSSGHANKHRPFPRCRRLCWRRPARKALIHRQVTPTRSSFSHPAGKALSLRRATPTRPSGNPFGE